MRFGCVWFDDFGKEGWASIAGGRSKRIAGTQDLESDVMWVTNLNWEGLRNKGIDKHPRYKRDDFLRVKLNTLSTELDIKNDDDVAQRVECLSEIMDRVCRLSKSMFNVSQIGDNMPNTLRAAILPEKDERSYGAPIVDYALKNALQTWQRCETVSPQGSNFYTWRFPRLDYAAYLFDFQIPTSRWGKIDVPANAKEYLGEHLNTTPMLCKINIKKIHDPIFGQIMPFGYGKQEQRIWASGQEVLHYMQYADVDVQAILVGTGFRDLQLRLPDFTGVVGKLSISMGILAECCWKSLCSKPTPRSVWFTSWDRLSLSKTAYILAEQDIPVMSYGSGAITLAVHQSQYALVFEKCIEAGLTPPLNMLSHMEAS